MLKAKTRLQTDVMSMFDRHKQINDAHICERS